MKFQSDKIGSFAEAILKDRYFQKGENFNSMIDRLCRTYSTGGEHSKRLQKYFQNLWFMPATPILCNGGTKKGFPISCYLNSVDDSMTDIQSTWTENVWLGSKGGGIGTDWSQVRSVGSEIKGHGKTTGIIPFIKVLDGITLAVSQGSLRRGAGACYLHISHPEIEEFIDLRKPTGDLNRRSLNIHHGVVISNEFMEKLKCGEQWNLIDPKTKKLRKSISARALYAKILETRVQTGEPYIVYEDNANEKIAEHHNHLNLRITQSNLCSEIMLPTPTADYNSKKRTAVCCLGSVNLEHFGEWRHNQNFICDCLLFLDNVLDDFIGQAAGHTGFENAVYSAISERSVGLGVMGLHSYFQKNKISFDDDDAKAANQLIFSHIHNRANEANSYLGNKFGSNPDYILYKRDTKQKNCHKRFSYATAIAPTANISIVCGLASPCVEPFSANIYTHKTLSGSFEVKNKYLESDLERLGKNNQSVWNSILENNGSVKHLDFIGEKLKSVYKTAFEIDQMSIINLAADRAAYIDQSQSINLFLRSDINKRELFDLHYKAWKKKLKSLYYVRSLSMQRAGFAAAGDDDNKIERKKALGAVDIVDCQNNTECEVCQ